MLTDTRPRRAARGPKYLRIHEDLAARIGRGEWAAGAPLPSQRELSQRYDVTLMTLRQAVALLEGEGIVETVPGRGTYIAPSPYAYDLGHLRSFSQDMRVQGAALQTRLLSSGPVGAHPAIASRLALSLRSGVFQIRRMRLLGSRPVVLQSSYLSLKDGKRLASADVGADSLYSVLAGELGIKIVRATESIRPTVLSESDARILGRRPGAAALASQHLSYAGDGRPVIDDIALLPGDTVSITADRSPAGLHLSYSFSNPIDSDSDRDLD